MIVYHTCRLSDIDSIKAHGLKKEMAKSRTRKAVWVHSRERMAWARQHLEEKCGGLESGMCVIKLEIPDTVLTRYADGVWYVKEDIDPSAFRDFRKYRLSLEKI